MNAINEMGEASEMHSRGLCCFELEGRAFALDVEVVTEVVTVDSILPIPRSPAFVLGLFTLRGSPVAVIDLGEVLGFGASPKKRSNTLLVMKRDELHAAFPVDRMNDVMRPEQGTVTAIADREHPAVSCFFTPTEASRGGAITVLDSNHLIRELRARALTKEGTR